MTDPVEAEVKKPTRLAIGEEERHMRQQVFLKLSPVIIAQLNE